MSAFLPSGNWNFTASARARQMRRELARWQRSGLKLREYGQQRGIPVSTLSLVAAGVSACRREQGNGVAAGESGGVHRSAEAGECSKDTAVVEIVLHSGHLVRVPAGVDADTLQRVLQALQTTC